MRLSYLGTPAIAVPPLRALVDAGHDIALVVTNPDKRRSRGAQLMPSPVKAAAEAMGLPVATAVDEVLRLDPPTELGVVVAFGRLIRPHVLERLPMVNVHFSLLPRWRGAAPVERAILAGDARTGVCLMEVAEELDAGGIYRCEAIDIDPNETADELRARLVAIAAHLLVDALATGFDSLGEPAPQGGEPTYAKKLDPAELEIDWSRPALDIHRLVRLGGAWTTFRGRRLKVWRSTRPAGGGGILVPTGAEPLELVAVQPEGRNRMDARAWANGARWHDGDALGT